MNEYTFVLKDGNEITIMAPTRVCAMEMFEEEYYDKETGTWNVEMTGEIKVNQYEEVR